MELRQSTEEEVNQVLNDMDRLWELHALITKEARVRVQEALTNHIKEYSIWDKLNPFITKIETFDDMLYEISKGIFETVDSHFLKSKGVSEFVSAPFLSYGNVCYFTEAKFNNLMNIAIRVGKLDLKRLRTKHLLLEKFATRPVTFDEDDIILYDNIRGLVSMFELQWKEYQDAL